MHTTGPSGGAYIHTHTHTYTHTYIRIQTCTQQVLQEALVAASDSSITASDITIGTPTVMTLRRRRVLLGTAIGVPFTIPAATPFLAQKIESALNLALNPIGGTFSAKFKDKCGSSSTAACNKPAVSRETDVTVGVSNYLLDTLAGNPSFYPPGAPGSCVFPGSAYVCPTVEVDAFGTYKIMLNASNADKIYYTASTCPVAIDSCSSAGSIPDITGSDFVANGDEMTLISMSPTEVAFPYDTVSTDIKNEARGLTGTRNTMLFPEYVTLRAISTMAGKTKSMLTSSTYRLPTVATTPTIAVQKVEVIGQCELSSGVYRYRLPTTNAWTTGTANEHETCLNLHSATTLAQKCNSAMTVPCRVDASSLCSSGTFGSTIYSDEVCVFFFPMCMSLFHVHEFVHTHTHTHTHTHVCARRARLVQLFTAMSMCFFFHVH